MNNVNHQSSSDSNGAARTDPGTGSSGPQNPAAGDKENFDDAVTEHLTRENDDSNGETARGSDDGKRNNQPALQEQDNEGNPAKTDNE
ncbi:hypothetical protein [Arthrobacter sp. H14]|uniref:hypothetical protein n=1 Tax=Arthrobacter sp. H14 TaxID=1312959 RepID=UPI00047A3B3A|nr:hypothetical protein [Arthrobacter sp. H14]